MARNSRRIQALGLLLLLAPIAANAQTLSNLPTLGSSSTSTGGKSTQSSAKTSAQTSAQTSSQKSTQSTNKATTTNSGASSTFALTDAPKLSTGSTSIFHLSGLPTVEGAGVPTLVIPYTANAPFMQKSSLPEGTFFIAVGATLAFFGACVLLWRATVAWSVNRSVKRTALASIGAARSEKSGRSSPRWTGSDYRKPNAPYKKSNYKSDGYGSNMSLEQLTSAGKPIKPHLRDSNTPMRESTTPNNLFFSPTAQARDSGSWNTVPHPRTSAHMPSGFYASPTASHPAAGAALTTIGGAQSHSQYAQRRYSRGREPSPPSTSRPGSRDYNYNRTSATLRPPSGHIYAQPSTSSLLVGQSSTSDLSGPTSRAPSAILEDMFHPGQHDERLG